MRKEKPTMREDLKARINATKVPYSIYATEVDDKTAEQFADCLEASGVIQAALMADCHGGYVAPIGSVIKTDGVIYPSFVGYDIGCGMSSIRTNIMKDDISQDELVKIKNQILRDIPIGFNRHNKPQQIPKNVLNMRTTEQAREILGDTGRLQLGTLGGGNHFLEIGYDNEGLINIVIHSGSRGVGHKIATHYMKEAAVQAIDEQQYRDEFDKKSKPWRDSILQAKPSPDNDKMQDRYTKAQNDFIDKRIRAATNKIEDTYPLDVNSDVGKQYIDDMNMALDFALANRAQMIYKCVHAIGRVLNKKIDTDRFINRNHNHAELVDDYWIHRKGATQADEGMMGVIPGNMVDGSFIVRGKGDPDSMSSSSHGAGRVLSRRKAKEQLDLEEFQECTAHLVANHSNSNIDEAPKAYKSIFEVMNNQSDLVEVIDRVVPILNIKG